MKRQNAFNKEQDQKKKNPFKLNDKQYRIVARWDKINREQYTRTTRWD